MKELLTLVTLLSINTSALADTENCYLYDSSFEKVTRVLCSAIDIEEAVDEGYSVFNENSADFTDGCLLSRYEGESLVREYDPEVCKESLGEGWNVVGEYSN